MGAGRLGLCPAVWTRRVLGGGGQGEGALPPGAFPGATGGALDTALYAADAQVHGSCAPKLAFGPEGLAPRGHRPCLFRNPWPSGCTSAPRASQPFPLGRPRPRGCNPPVSDPILGLRLLRLPVLPACFQALRTCPQPLRGCLLACLPPVDTRGPRSRCPFGSKAGGSPEPGAGLLSVFQGPLSISASPQRQARSW